MDRHCARGWALATDKTNSVCVCAQGNSSSLLLLITSIKISPSLWSHSICHWEQWLREFNFVESKIRTGSYLGLSLLKCTYQTNKQNEVKYGICVSVSGFNFPLWCPNQIWVSKEVYPWWESSWDFILHGTFQLAALIWSGHYLLLLHRCFCDLRTGPPLRPDSVMKCDNRGQGSLLLFKRIWKFHKQNIYYLRTRWQNLQPLGKTGGSSKFNILVSLKLGKQETPK